MPFVRFGEVLRYMYRGTIGLTVDNCVAVMAIARTYKILSLQKLVRDFFRYLSFATKLMFELSLCFLLK